MAACPQCVHESIQAGEKSPQHFLSGELDDDGLVHTTCSRGHVGRVVYDAPRYQILVESAARAFLDGYTNEVVAVLSTALERTYEFYLRVTFREKDISPEIFTAAWKDLASSSERQFGAFHLMHLLTKGSVMQLDKRIPEIRNKVVHRGHIVRESEALEFAELVFTRIRSIEKELESDFKQDSIAESAYQVELQKKLTLENEDSLVLKKMNVVVDNETNTVIGVPEKFLDVVAAIHHARERGFDE